MLHNRFRAVRSTTRHAARSAVSGATPQHNLCNGARLFRYAIPAVSAIVSTFAISNASAQTSPAPLGVWRVERGVVAPWVGKTKAIADVKAWIGRTVRFDPTRVNGPTVLSCGNAKYESVSQPPEGLFQGGLPAPAKAAAERLGMVKFPIPGVRLDCDKGSFDFHRVDKNTMLLAVDNVIWTLSNAPGANAQPATPSGVVQTFLERHFASTMGFEKSTLTPKQDLMTDTLRAAIAKYMARPQKKDEVPIIDGDPFTNSQEYPTRFAVDNANVRGAAADVSVRMSDGYRDQNVVFVLHQQKTLWRIADVRYEQGPTFTALIK